MNDFLVQTNIDWNDSKITEKWVDGDDLLESSVERRNSATNEIKNLLEMKDSITCHDLIEIFLICPVYNYQTIYITVMNPCEPLYYSMISQPPPSDDK